jgi:hypothetical protein
MDIVIMGPRRAPTGIGNKYQVVNMIMNSSNYISGNRMPSPEVEVGTPDSVSGWRIGSWDRRITDPTRVEV